MTMEFLPGGSIKNLKAILKKYYDDNENEELRNKFDVEITKLLELAEANRKSEALLSNQDMANEEEHKAGEKLDD